MNAHELARRIDHTVLKAEATREDIEVLCAEAAKYSFVSVCINPYWVPLAVELLSGVKDVHVCTVVGFPLGASTTGSKVREAVEALEAGATEIDMVVNLGALLGEDIDSFASDICSVRQATDGFTLKTILESALIGIDNTRKAAQIAADCGTDFLKTSTGFNSAGGATVEAIRVLAEIGQGKVLVKASGGIRDYATALVMLEAGADRLGTSSGVKIVRDA